MIFPGLSWLRQAGGLKGPPSRPAAVPWIRAAVLAAWCGAALPAVADTVVVFNEVMYHPATGEATNEWLELHNQNAVHVDLSGWRLAGGADYVFPPGTVIRGGGYLVVAASPAVLQAGGVTNVVGPWTGRLANGGETLRLRDVANRQMDSFSYDVDGDWPVAPDGSGASLAKRSRNLASAPPENWLASAQPGGTPGTENFPAWTAPGSPVIFNEVAPASPTNFWVELANPGPAPVDLAGLVIADAAGRTCTLPSQSLPAGALTWVGPAQLGFGLEAGRPLFLYAAGRTGVLDAVTVRTGLRGRFPNGSGPWLYPTVPSPGQMNTVPLRDDVIFNEVMYRHRPFDPVPAVTTGSTVVAWGGTWRYHEGGIDLGTTWRDPAYNDTGWAQGQAAFHYQVGSLAVPTNTLLAGGRSTYYFRTTFPFSGSVSNLTLDLRTWVDDGAVFYLNGAEICRLNMPAGPVTYGTLAVTPQGDATLVEALQLPAAALRQGNNVLAVEVHQAAGVTGATGLVLSGGGLVLAEEGPTNRLAPMNLAREPGSTPFVIDSLSGFPIHNYLGLTDGLYGNNNSWIGNSGSPGYAGVSLAGLRTVGSVAFGRDNTGTYGDRTLGTYTLQYTRVAAPGTGTAVTGNADTGWATVGTLNYQGAGTGLFAYPSRRHRFTFTPVTATGIRLVVPGTGIGSGTCVDELEINPPNTSGDVAFAAQLDLTTTLTPAQPYRVADEEWVELHNRGPADVDLTGWRLDAGVDYRFPTGTVLRAGGYLVVARDAAALQAIWTEVAGSILGNFAGRIQDGDEVVLKDAAGNPVDRLRVHGGGWSNGGGSSLERVDPRSDSSLREAWADSDETARGTWQQVSYRMVAGQGYGSSRWNEFRLGLLDDGVVLLDDISLVRDPDGVRQELLQNGGLDTTTGNTHWRFLGNHQGDFVPDPDNPANRVLRLASSGRAVMNHNHAETTLVNNTPVVDGQVYEVRYRGRWVAGSPQVSARAYFSRLARVTALPMPTRSGTPGSRNSRYATNAGPALSGLQHRPVVPATNQPVTITVRATDPDGVASLSLYYRVNPATNFSVLPMTRPAEEDWTAVLPGQPGGRIVQFYVEAVDDRGALAWAPAAGPGSRALYQVADGRGSTLPAHELRLIMLDADRDFMLRNTNVMSNARQGATLIYDRAEVFYDAGARLQGSAASRIRDGDNYVSYDIDFPPGRLFRGVHNNIGIDRSGRSPTVRGQDEIYVLHLFHQAGVPAAYSDLCYFIPPRTVHTGTAILQLAGYGSTFVEEQYGRVGSVFNMDVTYEPDTTVDPANLESPKLPVPLQSQLRVDFTDLGDREQYRAPFDIRLENRRDDYAGLTNLCRTLALPQDLFDVRVGSVLNVDEALRMAALVILCGIDDTYITAVGSYPHNLRLITFPDGTPAELLAWDMDFVFGASSTSPIVLYPDRNLSKLMNNPGTRRRYLHHLQDLCQGAFTPGYMGPWLAHYGSVVGQSYTTQTNYIASRRASALSQLPGLVPFAITSNGGTNFATPTNGVDLAGSAWVDVHELEVNGIPRTPRWTSVTNWVVRLPLAAGANPITVQGVDRSGVRRPAWFDSILITNTGPPTLRPVVINEWMADNTGPGGWADPADGLFQDWLELFNPNDTAVNLSGHYLTDNLSQPTKWAIPTNTIIPARGFLLVWADEDGGQNSATNADLHANFRLGNGGEAIGLFAPDGLTPQDAVTFGPQPANVSQGLYPDGTVGTAFFMTNWTPRAPNVLGAPPAPAVTRLTYQPTGVVLTFSGLAGRTYRIEYKDSLTTPVWTPDTAYHRAEGGAVTVVLGTGAGPQRFYRVRLE